MASEEQARARFCLEQLRTSPKTPRRNFLIFMSYVLDEEPAAVVAKRYGVTTQRVFEIKREMLRRLEVMLRELGMDPRGALICFSSDVHELMCFNCL